MPRRKVVVPDDKNKAIQKFLSLNERAGQWRKYGIGWAYIDAIVGRRAAGRDVCDYVDYDNAFAKKFPEFRGLEPHKLREQFKETDGATNN